MAGSPKVNTLVLGAGKIGIAVARMLAESGDYRVVLADRDAGGLALRAPPGVATLSVDAGNPEEVLAALDGQEAVVSALPLYFNVMVAEAAKKAGAHYFDLTEDVPAAHAIRALAADAKSAFAPQCGLAPGFISIVAHHLAARFDEVRDIHLRVGALPQFPDNALKYNLTWSTDGLVNEYCNPCHAIRDGRLVEAPPLEELEHFALDGVDYEAFNTSGGIGTLCETMAGKVRGMNYKTIRYPGHRDMVRMLAKDLRLCERRDIFRDVIEHAVPTTRQDVVLIFVSVTGTKKGLLTQESYVKKIYGDLDEEGWSAIQKTTAAGICAMVDLHREGRLPKTGLIRQEIAPYPDFIANRFGKIYA